MAKRKDKPGRQPPAKHSTPAGPAMDSPACHGAPPLGSEPVQSSPARSLLTPDLHGPRTRRTAPPYGFERLRLVLKLGEAPLDQVADEAAAELERLIAFERWAMSVMPRRLRESFG